jgi:hypothetical protein
MVFSYLDMGVLAGIGLMLSVGLLAYGRPYIFRQIWDFRKRLIPRKRDLQPAWQTFSQKVVTIGARLRSKKGMGQPDPDMPEIDNSLEEELADLSVELPAGKTQKNEVESLV